MSADTSMPDLGTQAVVDALAPPPSDISGQLNDRTAPQGPQPVLQQSTDPNAGVSPAEQAPQPGQQKGSLWRSILSGALQGLAAGSAVNSRGMGSAGAFAAGAGAGANQVLNVQPQQQAQLDVEKARQALYHANFAKVAYDLHKQMSDANDADLNQHIEDDKKLLQAGALRPVTMPTDSVSAMQQLQTQIQRDPAGQYRVSVTRGDDGTPAYQVVQSLDSPTQTDVEVTDRFGKKQTVPAGQVTGRQLEQFRLHELATGLDMKQQQQDESRKFKQQKELLEQKGDQSSDLADKKATAAASGQNVVAYDPEYQNSDGSKGANVVLDKATAQQRGLFSYKADPSTINSLVGGMNDVQNKLNSLADVVNDTKRMSQVDPKLAAAMLNPTTGVNLSFSGHGGGASGGIGVATDRINAWLNNANVKDANQATRDYVAAFLGAHEAITQLPRLQTFGKSSRMTETQLHAALNLLPQPGDTASFAQQKIENLQTMIDPLRKQIPHMPGADLIPSWLEQKQKPPAATHVFDPLNGVLNLLDNGGGQQ
jgi:hypothetical protein